VTCRRQVSLARRHVAKIVCRSYPSTKWQDAGPEDRLYGTLATQVALILKGAHIVRTHDVKAAVEAARVTDAILAAR